jgi:hypothetical protein
MAEMTLKEMEGAISAQAMKDESFRQEFLSNPKGAIEKYSGQALPADLKVQAHENSEKELHFVLPPKVSSELSDEDLEKVAGGEFVVGAAIITAVSGIVTAGASIANDQTRSRAGW